MTDVPIFDDAYRERLQRARVLAAEVEALRRANALLGRAFVRRAMQSDYTAGNLAYLREKYATGFITLEELEAGLDSVLRGGPVNVPKATK